MNAEDFFLPELLKIHQAFPKLKIVLEHVTTETSVDMVGPPLSKFSIIIVRIKSHFHAPKCQIKSLGRTVAATITVHHLLLTVDDWAGQPHNYCKPVAKFPHDRQALRDVVAQGEDANVFSVIVNE